MFQDPIPLTYAGVVCQFPRTGTLPNGSTYEHHYADGSKSLRLEVSHEETKSGRERCVVRLRSEGLIDRPEATGQAREASATASLILDRDPLHSPQSVVDLFLAIQSFFGSAALLRVAAGES